MSKKDKKKKKGKRHALDLDKKQTQIYNILQFKERFGLFLGAGSGKTRLILRHVFRLMQKNKDLKVLCVSTKANTISTWPNNIKQQSAHIGKKFTMHVEHPEYTQYTIPGKNCRYSARIIVCSYEHLKKLGWHYDNDYFDILVVDESVRIKNWNAKATSILLTFSQQCKYAYVLSGLPAPNKITDLFSQVFLLDGGERLGDNITAFRNQWLKQDQYSAFVWHIKGYPNVKKMERNEKKILKKIKDICVTEETEAFVKDVTEANYTVHKFDFAKNKERKRYEKFARKSILEIPVITEDMTTKEKQSIRAKTPAVLRNKLLQYVSGNIYEDLDPDEKRPTVRPIRRTTKNRMKAFDKLLKARRKKTKKFIVSYGYRHSIPDIMAVAQKYYKRNKIFIVEQGTSTINLERDWNNGNIDLIISFAGSIAEGLNLQEQGGEIIFYSLTYNYNHYYQLIRRIKRRGNPFKIMYVHILCLGNTVDELVVEAIDRKERLGTRVMSAAKLVDVVRRRLGIAA